jgi:pilus assembly protein Flp/PilA
MMKRFLRDERGSTAIEHSLIAVLISVAIIGGLSLMADEVTALFNTIEGGVTEATN